MEGEIVFSQIDFGLLQPLLDDDDITDISYSNGGQLWVKTLSQGVHPEHVEGVTDEVIEKLAFQCSNVMGKTFNMAHPFLDAESAELRMNFVHNSIATNGVALLIRKTPAKIRLNKDKLINEQYVTDQMHDFLIKCVWGHCNIMVAGETGSGKTELVKYLASNAKEDEKIISIEDTLELHLDKIYPNRDIVAMKTNNIASYTEALVACMRQNPIWILLAEVRSAEAVMAVRNSISSGHHVISTIHADKASSIPMRMYALLEGSQDIEQYLSSIHRYIQIGIYVKGYYSKILGRFQREIMEVCEFYVDEDNHPRANELYRKTLDGKVTLRNPSQKLIDYLAIGNVYFESNDIFGLGDAEEKEDLSNYRDGSADNLANEKPENKMGEVLNAESGGPIEENKTEEAAETPAETPVEDKPTEAQQVGEAPAQAEAPAEEKPVEEAQKVEESPATPVQTPVEVKPTEVAQPAESAPVAEAPAAPAVEEQIQQAPAVTATAETAIPEAPAQTETPVEEEPVLENPIAGLNTEAMGENGAPAQEDDQKPLLGEDTQVPEMVLPKALQEQQASVSTDIFAAPAAMPTADTVAAPVEPAATQSVNQIEVLDM